MTLPNKISDFEGQWHLKRVIQDAKAGQIVHADGQASLKRSDDGLIYEEEVTLCVPGQVPMKGTRRYQWREAEGAIAIYFEDGRYFHTLKLGLPRVLDHHDCPPDSYDAVYGFSGWPCWNVRWTVSGPRKSYEMNTEYSPR
ncbi:hypothetical protein HW561_07670 [Rhodobacteraceae bacterium B1Z28]|uniref:DUF6314 domain-containing protein n=1 Tax=Ruegeria haliotis TaxID=2747601 RepID=A0ABX2PPJ3_9RHOB|nr:DUF6314 family protein [Ruegeria haliotis]NVO55664.1 hypothetical protein [Ruegeria haliotis]